MKPIITAILALATAAGAQSTCTTPCTISAPASAPLPANIVTMVNGILYTNGVAQTTLNFTAFGLTGQTTQNGAYSVLLANGQVTGWTPAVSGGASAPSPSGTDYTVAVAQLAAYGETLVKVSGAVRAKGQSATVIQNIAANPTIASTAFHPSVYVNRIVFADPSGQVWLYIGNGNGSAYAASSWTVTLK